MTEEAKDLIRNHDTAVAGQMNVGVLLAQAIDKGLDVEGLERLVALQERVMERQAVMDCNTALANFQAEVPEVDHDSRILRRDGSVRNTYASLEHIRKVIRPYMTKYGLSESFPDADIADGMLRVTCIIRHASGHQIETKAPPIPFNVSGGAQMNEQQAMGSALSYAKRYALCSALGISTGERDDDAEGAGGKAISEEQAADLRALAEEVGADVPRFLKWLRVDTFAGIPEGRYQAAVDALERKRGEQ